MKNKFLKLIIELLLLILIGGIIFYYRVPISAWLKPYTDRFFTNLNYQIESWAPCQQPITLSLGEIDPRFNLSSEEATAAVNQASAIWSQPFGKPLFTMVATSGTVKINFVYDYRQETTDKLKKLGIVVGNDNKAYEELKAKYDILNRKFQIAKAELNQLIIQFDKQQLAYNNEVKKWNKQGGAPENIYNQLNQTKATLDAQAQVINSKTNQVNILVDDLNAEGTALNKLIKELNINATNYNTIGGAISGEFEEGVYIQDEAGRRIEVYEFNDQTQLIRLLAHELGHALNLDHSSGTTDIMYYLNEAGNDKLTANDLTALNTHCKVNLAK